MKLHKLTDMTRGWLCGDFVPSIFRTKDFEIGILTHRQDEDWPRHVHEIATEYNVLLSGHMEITTHKDNSLKGQILVEGDIFIIEPGESAKAVFLADCQILCIKVPSVPSDKYIINDSENL